MFEINSYINLLGYLFIFLFSIVYRSPLNQWGHWLQQVNLIEFHLETLGDCLKMKPKFYFSEEEANTISIDFVCIGIINSLLLLAVVVNQCMGKYISVPVPSTLLSLITLSEVPDCGAPTGPYE